MALATGPMMSVDARGKFGGVMVFGNWKGRPTVRKLVTPTNPKSGAQTGQRAAIGFLGPAWSGLSAAQQLTWDTLAAAGNFSAFNAYTQFNLDRWTQWLDPKQTTVIAAGTAPVMGASTYTGGVRQISVSQVVTTANDIWGIIIALSLTTGFTPAKSDVVAVVAYSASPVTRVLTGLAPGDYFIRTAGFTTGGTRSAFVAQGTATVT